VLTFKYSIIDKIDFLLGTIDNKERHYLPEPLYKPEFLFVSHPETGVQFSLSPIGLRAICGSIGNVT